MRGVGDRLVREHDGRMLAAYWAARWGREKNMTPLHDLLLGERAKPEPKMADTPDEIQRAFDAWVIATGGELGGGKKRRRRKAKATDGADVS